MEDELEALKPKARPAEMNRWNLEDLTEYRGRLVAEIAKIDSLMEDKKSVSAAAEALFGGKS